MIHRIHVTSFGIGCPQKIQVETIRNPKARNQKGVGIASLGFPFFEFEWIDWDLPRIVFSQTAIALGSSAIVKVSGQNCFRTLYGSLGQMGLGLLKGPALCSTKVPPRFHQGCASFVISRSSGADPFWGAKRFCGGFRHHFFKLVSQFLNSFFAFFPHSVSFEVFSHSKGLGAK